LAAIQIAFADIILPYADSAFFHFDITLSLAPCQPLFRQAFFAAAFADRHYCLTPLIFSFSLSLRIFHFHSLFSLRRRAMSAFAIFITPRRFQPLITLS
jgi:hypothetical protein